MNQEQDDTSARIRVGERATISPRGKRGTYIAEYWFDGQHRRKSLRTTNRRIARQRAVQIEAELEAGTLKRRPLRTTAAEAAAKYFDYLITETRAKRTLTRYRGELRLLEEFLCERNVRQLDQLTPALLDQYRAHRKKSVAGSTLHHETTVIKQFVKWAFSRGLIAQNPLAGYRVAKPIMTRKPVPSLEQVGAIIGQGTARLAVLVTLLVCTGMRVGEIQGLRKEDVDLKANFIHVRRQIDGPTKTKGERKIPVHPSLRPLLLKMLNADSHQVLVTNLPSRTYATGGRPISTRKLLERFQAAAQRAGLPRFTIHSLRHAFNTAALNAGVPLPLVRRWMGHNTRSMSELYYDAGDAESLRFIAKMPFEGLVAACRAAEGGLGCCDVRLVS